VRIISYIFILFIILLGITFAILNSEPVVFNYYVGHRTMALSLLLALTFGAGWLTGILLAAWPIIKTKMRNHQLKKRLKLAEKEVENLRAIPLQDKH